MCLGIPGQIVEFLDPEHFSATVDVSGVRRPVNVALVAADGPDAADVGDWVLVHVGFALARIDAEHAAQTREALELLGDAYEAELEEMRRPV